MGTEYPIILSGDKLVDGRNTFVFEAEGFDGVPAILEGFFDNTRTGICSSTSNIYTYYKYVSNDGIHAVLFLQHHYCLGPCIIVYLKYCSYKFISDTVLLLDFIVDCNNFSMPGHYIINCTSSNPPMSIACVIDGGMSEECSFPIVLSVERFGTDSHVLVITVTDGFGQNAVLEFNFQLDSRKLYT